MGILLHDFPGSSKFCHVIMIETFTGESLESYYGYKGIEPPHVCKFCGVYNERNNELEVLYTTFKDWKDYYKMIGPLITRETPT